MVVNERTEIADQEYEDSAWLWVEQYLDNQSSDTGMTFREIRQFLTRGSRIRKGEQMRVYEWYENDLIWSGGINPEPMWDNIEQYTVRESPEMATICKRLQLYP